MAPKRRLSIVDLPVEVLEDIADIVPRETQLYLCRVSKFFNSVTILSIYRDVCLINPSMVVACCRTLAMNKATAMATRQFSISYTPAEPPKFNYFSTFYSIVAKALSCLSQLQELRLMVYDPNYIHALASAHFPSLHHFECYLTLTNSLIHFLNHHPAITYLQIAPIEALPPPSPHQAQSVVVRLPKLQFFVGNIQCVTALVPDASLRAAFLFWDAVDATPQDAIKALERSSGDTLNLMSCRRRGWNLDLFELISTWLPNIYVLSVTNLLVVDARPSESYLNAIKSLLPRFNALRHLHLHCVDTWKMNDVRSNLDDDFLTITSWSAACPSLVECILPHSNNMKWLKILHEPRSYPSLWLPDPSSPQGVEWIWTMFSSKRYPQWGRLAALVRSWRKSKGYSVGRNGNAKGASAAAAGAYSREFEETVVVLRELSLGGRKADDCNREEGDDGDDGDSDGDDGNSALF